MLQEREAQLNFMRKRAQERESSVTESLTSTSHTDKAERHINFFSDIKQGVSRTDSDHLYIQ